MKSLLQSARLVKDHLRPQHLLNLTSASAEHGGENLLQMLTSLSEL